MDSLDAITLVIMLIVAGWVIGRRYGLRRQRERLVLGMDISVLVSGAALVWWLQAEAQHISGMGSLAYLWVLNLALWLLVLPALLCLGVYVYHRRRPH